MLGAMLWPVGRCYESHLTQILGFYGRACSGVKEGVSWQKEGGPRHAGLGRVRFQALHAPGQNQGWRWSTCEGYVGWARSRSLWVTC